VPRGGRQQAADQRNIFTKQTPQGHDQIEDQQGPDDSGTHP
jgi:hypothetical protein